MIATNHPQVSISGDSNQIFIAPQMKARAEDFFRPNLDDYRAPRFPRLSLTDQLIDRLRGERLLLITGEATIDKHEIARYLAGYLYDLLAREAANGNGRVADYQEWSGLNGQDIDGVLARYPEPTIFILPKLHPLHIDYDYQRLLRTFSPHHYTIISIDYAHPWLQWANEEPALKSYIQTLTLAETYPRRILADLFETFVGEEQIDPRRFRTGTDGRPYIGSQSIEQIAEQLQTPRRVREFVRLLSELPPDSPFTAQNVTESLKATQGGNTLRGWYQRLDEQRHHHLLALAIYLFDGLAEKQFFAAIDKVIEQVWRQREPGLRLLDYKDLTYLEHFFQFVPTKQGQRSIRTRSSEERRMLLDIVWEAQRRYITSTVRIFYDYITHSQIPQIYSELYGTKELCEQLRLTLTETISELGLRDVSDVELLLLHLAASPQIGVQAVAARVIARWYEIGKQQLALELLSHWVDEVSNRKLSASNWAANDRSTVTKPSNLRQTAALAIGYAAQSDAPEHLSPVLYEMILQLAQDRDDSVVGYVALYTLPMLCKIHLRKLQTVILCILRNTRWQETIVNMLIDAYRRQPKRIQSVLERWFEFHLHAPVRNSSGQLQAVWEARFRGICLIFQRLPYDQISGGISVELMIEHMLDVLNDECMPTDIRRIALDAVLDQSQSHYRYLRHFMPPATTEERKQIVRTLIALHREQLAQAPQIVMAEPFSVSSQSVSMKQTPVEQEVLRWISVSQDAIEQQIAIQLAIEFVRVRYAYIFRDTNEPQVHITVAQNSSGQNCVGLYPMNWYVHYIVAPFVTIDIEQLCPLVRNVLPVFLQQRPKHREWANQALHAWKYASDTQVANLAMCLRRARPFLWVARLFM